MFNLGGQAVRLSGYPENLDVILGRLARLRVLPSEPKCMDYSEAVISPPLRRDGILLHDGAVFDENSALVAHSIRKMSGHPAAFGPSPPQQRKAGKYLFAGPLHLHYGHFLLESLSRFWNLPGNSGLDGIVFVSDKLRFEELPLYLRDTLEKITDIPVLVTSQATQFETLVVPVRAMKMGRWAHRQFLDPFRQATTNTAIRNDRIYLSRAQLCGDWEVCFGGKCVIGESAIESHLAHSGVTVIYPELETVQSQIDVFRGAKVVAGVEGSALHNIVYSPSVQCIVLCRSEAPCAPAYMLDGIREGRSSYHWTVSPEVKERLVPGDLPRLYGPCLIDPAEALRMLVAEGFISSAPSQSEARDLQEEAIADFNKRKVCALVHYGTLENLPEFVDHAFSAAQELVVRDERVLIDALKEGLSGKLKLGEDWHSLFCSHGLF